MRKNKLFLLGLFVVFAAVLSLSLVSNTFARFASTKTGSDTARVAKWGVVISADNFDAFDEAYATDDTSAAISTVSVVAADSKNVLAPGTTRNLVGLAITGAPEVAVSVTYTATLTLENWKVGGADYCPLIFTVGPTEEYYIGKAGITTVAELMDAVEDAIADFSAQYDANTDLSGAGAPVVSWRWEIDQATVPGQTNEKDTALGDAAPAPTVSLAITATVTQID